MALLPFCMYVCSDTTLRCARWSSWSRTACRRRDSIVSAPSWLRTSPSCARTSETSPCLTSKTFWRAYVNTRTKLERLPLNRSVSAQHVCDLVWMLVSVVLLFTFASRIKDGILIVSVHRTKIQWSAYCLDGRELNPSPLTPCITLTDKVLFRAVRGSCIFWMLQRWMSNTHSKQCNHSPRFSSLHLKETGSVL